MKKLTAFCLLGIFASAPFATASAGVEEMAKQCASCHGADGNSTHEEVPNIGGMSALYLHDTMMAYKDGTRPGKKFKSDDGDETDMNAVAEKLSEEDIQNLADLYATKQFVKHAQQVDAKLAEAGKHLFKKNCEKCHSEGGSVAEDDASILSGQWKSYLHHEFELFNSGEREMPKKMAKRFERLNDQEKDALLEFAASGRK